MSKRLLIITFLTFSFIGNAQLLDLFGKTVVHEIKMNKQNDGTYTGAVEWTTGGKDSLQRYIVNDLDINAPVMVRIISKAPDHNIDLSFHKTDWDKSESKISTDGDKFADKIFRTMNTAGLGVRSKVAGIPYLITVKVGLQFPSTKSLIRITDNKEEYAQHLKKLGYQGAIFAENKASTSENSVGVKNSSETNNSLMYIIIGLLAVIAVVLIVFVLKRKTSKTTTLLVLCLGFSQFTISQNSAPTNISAAKQPTVFFEYSSQNLANQEPVRTERVAYVSDDPKEGTFRVVTVSIESNPALIELTGEEAEDINRRMQKATDEFNKNYRDNMPGEETQGDQRTLPIDQNAEELARLRRQVQSLQREVVRLSRQDEEFEPEEDQDAKILIYCEQEEHCSACMDRGFRNFQKRYVYYLFLQRYYLKKITDFQGAVAHADAIASVPGAGVGYPSNRKRAMTSIDKVRIAYNMKFDEYIESMKSDLDMIRDCYSGENSKTLSTGAYEVQVSAMIRALETSRINL